MSSAAPFSFHCIICYEAFDADDRPPVVLPCGHTYICSPCSKRLKRCTECRTSLFLPAPAVSAPQFPPQEQASHGYAQRHGHRPMTRYGAPQRNPPAQQQRQQQQREQIPLPLPKNLVMIAMMEAAAAEAERAAARRRRRRRGKQKSATDDGDGDGAAAEARGAEARGAEEGVEQRRDEDEDEDDGGSMATTSSSVSADDGISDKVDDDGFYESGDDDSAVRIGMSSLLASYGTYAVREKEGLPVLRRHPRGDDDAVLNGSLKGDCAPFISVASPTDVTEDPSEDSGSDGTSASDDFSDRAGDEENDDCTSDEPFDPEPLQAQQEEGLAEQDEQQQVKGRETDHLEDDDKETKHLQEEDQETDQLDVEVESGQNGTEQGEGQEVVNRQNGTGQCQEKKENSDKQDPYVGKENQEPEEVKEKKQEGHQDDKPFRIEYGQTVQVVDFTDGIATLARGRGYIFASSTQLVKVGAPLDKACQVEGMLRLVSAKEREYEKKLNETRRLRSSLGEDLKEVLSSARDHHPVIAPLPEPEDERRLPFEGDGGDGDDNNVEENREGGEGVDPPHQSRTNSPPALDIVVYSPQRHAPLVPATHELHATPARAGGRGGTAAPRSSGASGSPHTPNTIDNSDIGVAAPYDPEVDAESSDARGGDGGGEGEGSEDYILRRQDSHPAYASMGCPLLGDRYLWGRRVAVDDESDVQSLVGMPLGMSFDSSLVPAVVQMGLGRGSSRGQSRGRAATADEADRRDNRPTGHGSDAAATTPLRPPPALARRPAAAASGPSSVPPPLTPDRHRQHGGGLVGSSTSFDAIDYRTGFSCHRGISSTRNKSDQVSANAQAARGVMRMMSEHRGISKMRPIRRRGSQEPPTTSVSGGSFLSSFMRAASGENGLSGPNGNE